MGELEIFSTRIKELRETLGMTQNDFSKHVGIKQQTLSGYERGIMKPPIDVVKNLAEKCHVSIDWLCGLSENERNQDLVETYSDLYRILLLLESKIEIKFDTAAFMGGYEEPHTEYTQAIWFNNNQVCAFMEEWEKMKSLHDNGTIDDDVYNLWKEKVLTKEDNTKQLLNKPDKANFELPF